MREASSHRAPPTCPLSTRFVRPSRPSCKDGEAKKAIVFGSYARGDADRHSDLDLIVVVDTERSFFKRHEGFAGLYDVWRRGMDLLIYTPDELADMLAEHRDFIETALEEGVVIYEE